MNSNERMSYILGLFEGDGYQWTGTFGVTNRNREILKKASEILSDFGTVKWKSDDKGFFRVCITSRPAKRKFLETLEKTKENLLKNDLSAFYFAGKYDADGTRWKTRNRLKITYNIKDDFEFDIKLLKQLGIQSKIRNYKNRNAVALEISSSDATKFTEMISPFSVKLDVCSRTT